MSYFDDTYAEYAKLPYRHIYLRAIFYPNTPAMKFVLTGNSAMISATVTQPYSSGGLTLGEVCISQCDLKFYDPSMFGVDPTKLLYKGAKFDLYIGFIGEDGEIPFEGDVVDTAVVDTAVVGSGGGSTGNPMKIGRFYADEPSSTDGWRTIELTGYDGLSLLSEPYEPQITFPASASAIYNDIKTQFDSDLGFSYYCVNADVTDSPADANPSAEMSEYLDGSVAEYLGWLAGLIGTNVIMHPTNGMIFRRPYYLSADLTAPTDDYIIERGQQYLHGTDVQSEDAFTLQSLTCYWNEDVIEAGSGVGITFSNPMMTQDILTDLAWELSGFKYYPCTSEWRGFPEIRAGDTVFIEMEDSEYLPVLITEQVITVDGGLKSDISAVKTESNYTIAESPTAKQISKVYQSLKSALEDAAATINGAKGGIFRFTDTDGDGINDGFIMASDASLTTITDCIVGNFAGIGFSTDGGATYQQAITHSGITADAITTGKMSAERIEVNGETLADYFKVYTESGEVVVEIGSGTNSVLLKQKSDRISFCDTSGDELAYWTNNSFVMRELQTLQLGVVRIVAQPNGSISFVSTS